MTEMMGPKWITSKHLSHHSHLSSSFHYNGSTNYINSTSSTEIYRSITHCFQIGLAYVYFMPDNANKYCMYNKWQRWWSPMNHFLSIWVTLINYSSCHWDSDLCNWRSLRELVRRAIRRACGLFLSFDMLLQQEATWGPSLPGLEALRHRRVVWE